MEVVGQVDALRGGSANVGRAVVNVPLAVLAFETWGGERNEKSQKFPILYQFQRQAKGYDGQWIYALNVFRLDV